MTEGAAGLDLCACSEYGRGYVVGYIEPGERLLVKTGIVIQLPPGHEAQVRPRSGLAIKHGIAVLNSPGTIDQDFRSELGVILINHGDTGFLVSDGDRIAQLVIAPVTVAALMEVDELDETVRGEGGFGSTGV